MSQWFGRSTSLAVALMVPLASVFFTGCTAPGEDSGASIARDQAFAREQPFVKRPLRLESAGRWIGNAIAYGPHRDGQFPGGPGPTKEQLREDLELMSRHWNLLRVYGAIGTSEDLLEVIRDEGFDMKVMLGAWVGSEERRDVSGAIVERFPETRAANRAEVESAIRLANEYPQIVVAVCVGNETQVFWSDHRVAIERVIELVRLARANTEVPVTVADDFNFWNKPESQALADELDFLVMHAHPMWNGIQLEDAVKWTDTTLGRIRAAHPDHDVVLGEFGWATQVHDEGEQAQLIKGEAGEEAQAVFYRTAIAWVNEDRIPTFFFEAFDENWKGGEHPSEVEKHWGLFRADRTPKQAMAHGR